MNIPKPIAKPKMDFWSKYAFFLLLGFAFQARSFSYVGVPQIKLFIGDVSLAAFFLFRGRDIIAQWFRALTRNLPATPLFWLLLLSLFYGVIETFRGIHAGFVPLTTVQMLVFNVYPLFIFWGIWAGSRNPDLIRKFIRITAWYVCFYGPAYLLVLNKITATMPGAKDVPIFSQTGGALILIGIFCLEQNPAKYWLPLAVGAFTMLATQVRSEWLGFIIMLGIWGFLSRKMGKVFAVAGLVVVLLALGFALDVNLPSAKGRGGAVSSREIVARAMASVNPELAEEYSSAKTARFYAGTIYWRTRWWHEIWDGSNEDTVKQLIGPGYGYPLNTLVSELKNSQIRTPHNVFFFCLGYTGWIGVVLFVSLQLCIFQLLWRTFVRTRNPFGICLWASTVVAAFFGNLFETPFGAIPSYMLVGIVIAPALREDGVRFVPSYALRVAQWRSRLLEHRPVAPAKV